MNDNTNISDELLARYLSGQVSPEEEELVLNNMAANDENSQELLAMASAIKEQQYSEKPQHSVRPFIWATAASILIVLGVSLFVMLKGGDLQTDQSPILASQDSIDITDTLTNEMLPCHE